MRKMISLAASAAALAACASAYAVDELSFEPSADSYDWQANQPHGELEWMAMWQEVNPVARQGIAMIAFDLSSLSSIDPNDIVSARLELQAWYSGKLWNLVGDAGELSVRERASAFDEVHPSPPPDSIGPVLDNLIVPVGYHGIMALESAPLLAEVRDWAVNPGQNYGLDIYFEALDGADATFYMSVYSSEYPDVELRPRLVVGVNNVPAPGVGTLLGAGVFCLVRRRRAA